MTVKALTKPKRAPKTLKEKRFVKEYIENGGNGTQAALKVYDTVRYDSAQRIGSENTSKLNIPDLFEKYGVTDELLVTKLKNGLSATKVVTSYTEPDKIVEDFGVQHSWWKDAMKIKGHLVDKPSITNNIVIPILGKSIAVPTNHIDEEGNSTQEEN